MKVALRTQQIIAEETRVPNVVDPLGGSYYVEALTDEIESAVFAILKKVDDMGGTIRAIEEGFFQRAIAQSADEYAKQKESGEQPVIGINKYVDPPEPAAIEIHRVDPESEARQLKRLRAVKMIRDNGRVERLLDELAACAADPSRNLMPATIPRVKARASMGEIVALCMEKRRFQMRTRIGTAMAAVILLSVMVMPLAAQAPRRTPDGKPDLSGVWQVLNTAAWDIQDHAATKGVPAGQGVVEGNAIPYQPAAAAKRKENFQNRATADPETKCYLPGVPRITYMPYPFHIVQTPKQVTILYEYVHAVRNIFMDTPHPRGPIEWWMGDSRGRWEGDTLVVDVVHFNDETWFDRVGNFHSDALHVVERYTPTDANHINYEVTIEDPKVFTRAWKMSMPLYRRVEPNVQVLEYECYALEEQK